MGGGAGMSVNGAFRIATEQTMFAMPETGIGLFPDVGATRFLNLCPGQIGRYLGLTGARLGPADAMSCGLATHFVPADRLEALLEGLARALQPVRGDEVRRQTRNKVYPPRPAWRRSGPDSVRSFRGRRQETRRPDIGEKADRGLRHRENGAARSRRGRPVERNGRCRPPTQIPSMIAT